MSQEQTAKHRFPAFQNRLMVFKHLEAAGYKVSTAKLYRDFDDGKIIVEPDGSVLEVEVRSYALTYLTKIDGSTDDLKGIQEIKARKEVEKLNEQIAKLRFDREKEQGKFIPSADFAAELAARGAVFDSGFRHLFNTNVHEWIALVGGKPEKAADFLESLNKGLDTQLNKYSTMDGFQIIFTLED